MRLILCLASHDKAVAALRGGHFAKLLLVPIAWKRLRRNAFRKYLQVVQPDLDLQSAVS
jgi:hypothetical protein